MWFINLLQQTGDEMFNKAITHITWYFKMPHFFLWAKGWQNYEGNLKEERKRNRKNEKKVKLQGNS